MDLGGRRKKPVDARFHKATAWIVIPGAPEFSLVFGEEQHLHASLPELADVSLTSLVRAVEEFGDAIDDPYLKIYFYGQGPTFNPGISPREPFTLEILGKGRVSIGAQLKVSDPDYEPYPELHLAVTPLLSGHKARPRRSSSYNEWGKVAFFFEFEYESLRGVRVRDAYSLATKVGVLGSAVAKRGNLDCGAVEALIQSGQGKLLVGQKEHRSFEAKGTGYELSELEEKYELSKDVAAFANSDSEGLVVCGLRTRKVRGSDVVREVTPVNLEGVRPRDWIKVIRRYIVPAPEGIRVETYRANSVNPKFGFILISVPRQPAHLKPFLLPVGKRDDGKIVETDIAVPIRIGEDTEYADAASLHSLMAAGRTALGQPEEN